MTVLSQLSLLTVLSLQFDWWQIKEYSIFLYLYCPVFLNILNKCYLDFKAKSELQNSWVIPQPYIAFYP